MASSFGEVLAVLRDFRIEMAQRTQAEFAGRFAIGGAVSKAFAARGGLHSAFATPMTNVHATGVGVRVRQGKVIENEFVIKVYVFDKLDLGDETPDLTRRYGNVGVDVEPLPIQYALATRTQQGAAKAKAKPQAAGTKTPQRDRQRPIPGGVSIAPLNESYVGTLGCYVKRVTSGIDQTFVLSNNHVLADTNRLTIGTTIVQPGPEVAPTAPNDAFAALSAFVPIDFPSSRLSPVVNRYDAAIAVVTDLAMIQTATMFGIGKYDPNLKSPVPGMRVVKSGRTTGITRGTIIATRVNNVQVNYGSSTSPRIATFADAITIVGDDEAPFSAPGDSGSVILEESSRRPVALLFAGDGRTTTACDLAGACQQFEVLPV